MIIYDYKLKFAVKVSTDMVLLHQNEINKMLHNNYKNNTIEMKEIIIITIEVYKLMDSK